MKIHPHLLSFSLLEGKTDYWKFTRFMKWQSRTLLSANRVDLGFFFFTNFPILPPPPPGSRPHELELYPCMSGDLEGSLRRRRGHHEKQNRLLGLCMAYYGRFGTESWGIIGFNNLIGKYLTSTSNNDSGRVARKQPKQMPRGASSVLPKN